MSFFKGIIRTALSPVEVVARTAADVFSDQMNDDGITALDVCTLGVSRVARGAARGMADTFEQIKDEFDE